MTAVRRTPNTLAIYRVFGAFVYTVMFARIYAVDIVAKNFGI